MARGHTIPNLVRQRRRLIRIIKRNGILVRAQAAVITALKGKATMRTYGEDLTPEQVLLRSVAEMKAECERIQREVADRDSQLAHYQAWQKELSMDLAQVRAENDWLARRAERAR